MLDKLNFRFLADQSFVEAWDFPTRILEVMVVFFEGSFRLAEGI